MTPEGLGAMTTIIDWLIKRPDSADFRAPLDWQGLGLNDYPKVIEKPMDLATVKQNLNLKRYRTIHNCADDIRLIWSNCKKYNGEGSVYYSLADSLSKIFEEYFDVARYGPCIKTEKRGRDADQSEEASKKMRKSINDVAADLVCPITQELPIDPVMAEDGKIYERNAILEWFSEKGPRITSPSTNARMGTRLLPAVQTRNGRTNEEHDQNAHRERCYRGRACHGLADEAGGGGKSEGGARESGSRKRVLYVSARCVVPTRRIRPREKRWASPRVVRAQRGRPPPTWDGSFW